MTKKLIIIVVFLTIVTSGTLYSCSINNTKKAVVNNVKSVLQTKNFCKEKQEHSICNFTDGDKLFQFFPWFLI